MINIRYHSLYDLYCPGVWSRVLVFHPDGTGVWWHSYDQYPTNHRIRMDLRPYSHQIRRFTWRRWFEFLVIEWDMPPFDQLCLFRRLPQFPDCWTHIHPERPKVPKCYKDTGSLTISPLEQPDNNNKQQRVPAVLPSEFQKPMTGPQTRSRSRMELVSPDS